MTVPRRIRQLQDVPRPVVAAASDYPADHKIARHSHPRSQLIYAERGVMTVTTGIGVWVIPPQRAVWVPAGMEHRVGAAAGPIRMRSLFVAAGAKAGLPAECCVVTVSPLLRELILRAVEIPPLYDPGGADGRLMDVILDQLQRLPVTPLHLPMATDARLGRITTALRAEPGINRTLAEWSNEAGASARTLSRLFVKETGMTFGAWRQQARLLKALEMLAGGQLVTAAALDLGYQSPSAFVAMFRRALGVSPGRYFARRERRRHS